MRDEPQDVLQGAKSCAQFATKVAFICGEETVPNTDPFMVCMYIYMYMIHRIEYMAYSNIW